MALNKLAGDCDDLKTCPGIFDEGEHVRVQGPEAVDGLTLGPGETGVRIPVHLILEAAERLKGRQL